MNYADNYKNNAEYAANEPYSTQIGPFGKALTPKKIRYQVSLLTSYKRHHGRFNDDEFVFIIEDTGDRLCKYESYTGDILLFIIGMLGQIGLMLKNRKYHRYIMDNSMLRFDVT